jgi:Uma2 family endonuclease
MFSMGVDLLTGSFAASLPALGPYRRRDYEQLPDQPRHELLFGRLYVTPAPTLGHGIASQVLWPYFDRIAMASGGLAFYAPADVALADHSVVQPDILYISAARLNIAGRHVEGAPDLVVEILSPSTAHRDKGEKLLLYALYGVQEYWLTYLEERRFEFLINEEGRFVEVPHATGVYQSPKIPEVRLDVSKYWRQVEAKLRRLR